MAHLKHTYKTMLYTCVWTLGIYTYTHKYVVSFSASHSIEVVELLGRLLKLAKAWTSTGNSDL